MILLLVVMSCSIRSRAMQFVMVSHSFFRGGLKKTTHQNRILSGSFALPVLYSCPTYLLQRVENKRCYSIYRPKEDRTVLPILTKTKRSLSTDYPALKCCHQISGSKILLGKCLNKNKHRTLSVNSVPLWFESTKWTQTGDTYFGRHRDTLEFKNFKSFYRAVHEHHGERKVIAGSQRNISSKYKELRENISTVPNLLSLIRIVLSPVIGYMAISEQYFLALGILGVAAVTDMLDGYIARHFQSQKSVFGSILDPAADKILMTVLVVSLSVANLIPAPLGILIVARDVLLVASVSYLRFKTLPPPRTVARYFDVNHPTVQLHPTYISKVNTFLQMGLLGAALAAPIFQMTESVLLSGYMYLVATTTIASAFSYVFSKDTFKILKNLPK